MAEETMKDFEKELEESYKNMDTKEDPQANKWEVSVYMPSISLW